MEIFNEIIAYFSGLNAVELSFFFVVAFMFTLAVIDLTVGVSNDAVNFLSAAVGSKAAKIKHVLLVAAVGVFIGAHKARAVARKAVEISAVFLVKATGEPKIKQIFG